MQCTSLLAVTSGRSPRLDDRAKGSRRVARPPPTEERQRATRAPDRYVTDFGGRRGVVLGSSAGGGGEIGRAGPGSSGGPGSIQSGIAIQTRMRRTAPIGTTACPTSFFSPTRVPPEPLIAKIPARREGERPSGERDSDHDRPLPRRACPAGRHGSSLDARSTDCRHVRLGFHTRAAPNIGGGRGPNRREQNHADAASREGRMRSGSRTECKRS